MFKLGLDIDDTITKSPDFFKILTESVKSDGGEVHIVSGRTQDEKVAQITTEELQALGIKFDKLFLLPPSSYALEVCPHEDLDWYQKYLWQKVDYCHKNKINVFFDDDPKVIALFLKFAEDIQTFQVGKQI